MRYKKKGVRMIHSSFFRAERIAYIKPKWIMVLDQKFSVGQDKLEVLIEPPSRHAEQAVGDKSLKFKRELLVKDIHLGNISLEL